MPRVDVLAFSLCLVACTPWGKPAARAAEHDLASHVAAGDSLPVATIAVSAPSWLGGRDMHYRLAWHSGSQRMAYAESRWSAPPAEMLQVDLRRRLAVSGASTCRLHVELDEFIQHFDAPDRSQVRLAASVRLLAARADLVRARLHVDLDEAGGRDAASGVAAYARLSERLAQQLSAWLARTQANGVEC